MTNKSIHQNRDINKSISFKESPLIMGILNITPDSFYDGGVYKSLDKAKINSKYKFTDIVDIGCESTRPGSLRVDSEIQIKRLNIFLNKFKVFLDYPLSIDSTQPSVIKYALENGFSIVNDISAGTESEENFDLAKHFNSYLIIMHMQNSPYNMQDSPRYSNIVDNIFSFFEQRIEKSISYGLNTSQIILDPGFGFGKTLEHNLELLNSFDKFKSFECKMMAGVSRKSFLAVNNNKPDDRLLESLFAAKILINKGVDILRVHDVNETHRLINFLKKVQ
ncbi:MAG: dihydropteroate synthase [bacterium TMED198]|nr:MAG: dihydropteroate synthase [bacterium TMED198]